MSYKDIINSPRTLEAMECLGILGAELDDVNYESIRDEIVKRERKQSIPKIVVDLRFENLQKKRHQKKLLIEQVRILVALFILFRNEIVSSTKKRTRK